MDIEDDSHSLDLAKPNKRRKSPPKMAAKWSDPPPDILPLIADHLDRNLGTLRLRSVCKSWRLSLSSNFPPSLHFPLTLPFPPSIPPSSSSSPLSLRQRTICLLSPLSGTPQQQSFILKVEERENHPNSFSLISPLSSRAKLPLLPNSHINLLHYRATHVCDSYVVHSNVPNFFKKVVVARGFFESGDFVVLGLQFSGKLWLWKIGDVGWTKIGSINCCFDDIISFRGKFYGIADRRGKLVMFDSRLFPIVLIPKLMYGNGGFASLVECDGNLYLVDREYGVDRVKMGVFRLDDKGRFWDYEPDLNGGVFFLGDDVNFALSKKDYDGIISDFIYFKDAFVDDADEDVIGLPRVFDVTTGNFSHLIRCESFARLFSPPWSLFSESAADEFG